MANQNVLSTFKVFVELETPSRERFAVCIEANPLYLHPIHINRYPWNSDSRESIRQQQKERAYAIEGIKHQVGAAFEKYFLSVDTLNGEKQSDRRPYGDEIRKCKSKNG